MNLGEAVKLLEEGKMVQRKGWNGKGLFVFRQVPANIYHNVIEIMQSLPQPVKDEFKKRFKAKGSLEFFIKYSNQLALVDQENNISGWSPSTPDALANDWVEYVG